METFAAATSEPLRPRADAERHAWEAERIAEARAELDDGQYVAEADVDAWIESLDTDHELPPPSARRR